LHGVGADALGVADAQIADLPLAGDDELEEAVDRRRQVGEVALAPGGAPEDGEDLDRRLTMLPA
jgi:hypothetical protein